MLINLLKKFKFLKMQSKQGKKYKDHLTENSIFIMAQELEQMQQ